MPMPIVLSWIVSAALYGPLAIVVTYTAAPVVIDTVSTTVRGGAAVLFDAGVHTVQAGLDGYVTLMLAHNCHPKFAQTWLQDRFAIGGAAVDYKVLCLGWGTNSVMTAERGALYYNLTDYLQFPAFMNAELVESREQLKYTAFPPLSRLIASTLMNILSINETMANKMSNPVVISVVALLAVYLSLGSLWRVLELFSWCAAEVGSWIIFWVSQRGNEVGVQAGWLPKTSKPAIERMPRSLAVVIAFGDIVSRYVSGVFGFFYWTYRMARYGSEAAGDRAGADQRATDLGWSVAHWVGQVLLLILTFFFPFPLSMGRFVYLLGAATWKMFGGGPWAAKTRWSPPAGECTEMPHSAEAEAKNDALWNAGLAETDEHMTEKAKVQLGESAKQVVGTVVLLPWAMVPTTKAVAIKVKMADIELELECWAPTAAAAATAANDIIQVRCVIDGGASEWWRMPRYMFGMMAIAGPAGAWSTPIWKWKGPTTTAAAAVQVPAATQAAQAAPAAAAAQTAAGTQVQPTTGGGATAPPIGGAMAAAQQSARAAGADDDTQSVGSTTSGRGKKPKRCNRCNQTGHVARECTAPAPAPQGGAVLCHRCKQPGHVARECTSPAPVLQGGEAASGTQQTSNAQSAAPAATQNGKGRGAARAFANGMKFAATECWTGVIAVVLHAVAAAFDKEDTAASPLVKRFADKTWANASGANEVGGIFKKLRGKAQDVRKLLPRLLADVEGRTGVKLAEFVESGELPPTGARVIGGALFKPRTGKHNEAHWSTVHVNTDGSLVDCDVKDTPLDGAVGAATNVYWIWWTKRALKDPRVNTDTACTFGKKRGRPVGSKNKPRADAPATQAANAPAADAAAARGDAGLSAAVGAAGTKARNASNVHTPSTKLTTKEWPSTTLAEELGANKALEQVTADFQLGQQPTFPMLAQLKGRHLKSLKIHAVPKQPDLARDGKVMAVRKGHIRELLRMQEFMPEDLLDLPLAAAIVHFYTRRKLHREWSWQSLHRSMASVHGAFSDISMYTDLPDGVRINLNESTTWRNAMKRAGQIKQESAPANQPAATSAEIAQAIARTPELWIKALIALAWLGGSRVGDVLQLKKEEVLLKEAPTGADCEMDIHFRRGKGVQMSQPYHVATKCPALWRQTIKEFLDTREVGTFLFPTTSAAHKAKRSAQATAALRVLNKKLGQRAVRRGALQALAADPNVSLQTLMQYSGHKREETLMRYLDWGRMAAGRNRQGAAAAGNLFYQDTPMDEESDDDSTEDTA